jgi:Predicted Zn-dependent peptidases
MDTKLIHGELKNGIRYNFLPMKEIKTFSIVLSFKVGARDEDSINTGYSHLLEHMLFKGTENIHTPDEL